MEVSFEEAFEGAINVITKHSRTVLGVVKSVDMTEFTCEVEVDSATYPGVPLRVLTGSQASFIEIPAVDTNCLLVCRFGSIQSLQILMVDQTDKLLINCNQVEFNKGKNGGLINVVDLVTRMNNLEKDNNTLKSLIAAWTPVPNDGGAALKTTLASWAAQQLSLTTRGQIEDTTVTH